ncbi:LysE family translocator [Siculibacillus lacustris]|uniref:LysE family translocator n=1 Tax=Siculibacillus lacustris TaxID=1549641 RepID=A0A4Q9VKI4_9HYPH|nr:LysE family translocator [Siculibacillus lacustris]TBW35928.1 LysE family translocator [Siculibacillus lacustris]
MDWTVWLAFVAASAVLVVIPGPTVLLIVSHALGQGWRSTLPLAVGVALGDVTAMTASLAGVGALLQASATVFLAVKWIGAAYLVFLGVRLFRAGGTVTTPARSDRSVGGMLVVHAWLVTALNPKGILFFVAFLPQFVDPHAPLVGQWLLLEATFVTIAFANVLAYTACAARAGRLFGDGRMIGRVNRAGGTALVCAGLATAVFAESH